MKKEWVLIGALSAGVLLVLRSKNGIEPTVYDPKGTPVGSQKLVFLAVPGYRRMKSAEVDATMRQVARDSLKYDIGHIEYLEHAGVPVAVAIENHFHEPNGPVKPWGWHKGASLFVKAT